MTKTSCNLIGQDYFGGVTWIFTKKKKKKYKKTFSAIGINKLYFVSNFKSHCIPQMIQRHFQ